MKKLLFTFIIAGIISSFSFASDITPTPLNIEESVIVWKGYKVLGSHEGTIKLKSGALDIDLEGNLTGGSFVIDMGSIANTDMDGQGAEKLVGHLKSDDFFGVENHPTANFQIKEVVSRGTAGSYKIVGDLTIKGITKEIKFNAMLNEGKATAEIKIDRSEFDIRYGSGSFFDNLGDKTIYDEFDLIVNLAY